MYRDCCLGDFDQIYPLVSVVYVGDGEGETSTASIICQECPSLEPSANVTCNTIYQQQKMLGQNVLLNVAVVVDQQS